MQEFVCGFYYDFLKEELLLIEKQKPDWMKGLYNGVGEKVEANELCLDAMVREFKEETDIDTTSDRWLHFLTLHCPEDSLIHFYFNSFTGSWTHKQTTDEKLFVIKLKNIYKEPVIPNLRWIIPLALENNNNIKNFLDFPLILNYYI